MADGDGVGAVVFGMEGGGGGGGRGRGLAVLGLGLADGGGGGGGGGRGRGATPSHAALGDAELADYAHIPFPAGYEAEAYHGEREDLEFLSILLADHEQPRLIGLFGGETSAPYAPGLLADHEQPRLIDLFGEETSAPYAPDVLEEGAFTEIDDANVHAIRGSNREDAFVMVPFNMIVVEHDQDNQVNDGDLSSYLREGQWERALLLLEHMVADGKADNGAVEADAPEGDIYKAHPELVLWLRGQIYVDLREQGCLRAAQVYYRDYIAAVYPDGVSTDSSFVDNIILGSLKKLKRTGSPQRGSKAFQNREETRKCVEDYLKVYFPGYRETDSRVWEFGRKEDDIVRCFVCHKEYRGLNLTKLEQHLQGFGQGRQGKCPALTIYITQRLEQILAAEELAGSRRRGPRAVVPPGNLPPPPLPPPPDAGEDAAAP